MGLDNNDHTVRVSRSLPLEERIRIYEKKYGRDFVYKKPEREKKSIFKRISELFKK